MSQGARVAAAEARPRPSVDRRTGLGGGPTTSSAFFSFDDVPGPMRFATPAPYFYLRKDEPVILRVKPAVGHAFRLFVVGGLAVTIAVALAMFLGPLVARDAWISTGPLAAMHAGAMLIVAVLAWRRWATTEFAVTDARIYTRTGRLVTRVHFTTHDKITDIQYVQSPLERLFGTGRLRFATAGGDVGMVGLADPLLVKETAEVARDAFVRRLLERAGVQPAAPSTRASAAVPVMAHGAASGTASGASDLAAPDAPAPRPPPPAWSGPRPGYLKAADTPIWYGKPRLVAAIAGGVPFIGLTFVLFVTSFLGNPIGFIGAPLALGLLVVSVGLRALQLHRTEYVATDRSVYMRSGVLGTTVSQLTYDKITDLTFRQDLIGRILGYGSVTINTAGSTQAPVTMTGLAAPLELKETVERARARYLREEEA